MVNNSIFRRAEGFNVVCGVHASCPGGSNVNAYAVRSITLYGTPRIKVTSPWEKNNHRKDWSIYFFISAVRHTVK